MCKFFCRKSFLKAKRFLIFSYSSFFLLFFFGISLSFGQIQWTGNTDNNWNTPGNWSTGSVPGPADDVLIDLIGPFGYPVLNNDIIIRDLTLNITGRVDLNGFTLSIRNVNSNNGEVENGVIRTSGNNVNFQNSIFTGNITIIKDGGNNNNWEGGNVFLGPATIINNSNNRIRLANTDGDTFNSTSTFINNGTNRIDIAHRGTNTFAESITIDNNAGGDIRISEGGGVSTLTSGAILTNGFIDGTLEIRNFTQETDAPNGSFTPEIFWTQEVDFLGDIQVNTTSTSANNSIRLRNNSRFEGNNVFNSSWGIVITGGGNRFSTIPGNNTVMVKNGNNNNDWHGGNTFGDFTLINNGSGRIRVANSIAGDIYEGNALFNQNGTGALEPARNNNNIFLGDISTVGSAFAITFGAGNGVTNIQGNMAQFLNGDADRQPTIRRLVMNTTGNLTAEIPFTVRTSLTLNEGIIYNDENILTLSENGTTVAGASNISHVDGIVRKVGRSAFIYPVGNNGFYAPLSLPDHGGGGGANNVSFDARYFNVNPELIPSDRTSKVAEIELVSECEYWELEQSDGPARSPRVTLSWDATRSCEIVDYEEFLVIWWDGAEWISYGGDNITGSNAAGTVTSASNISTFIPKYFTLGQSFSITPIELLSFTVKVRDQKSIKIKWTTAKEWDNDFFTLEKSIDADNWSVIGTVPAVGFSDDQQHYDFIDENPVFGRQFYRLTQTDLDGTSETFQIVAVSLSNEASPSDPWSIMLYPNPSTGSFTLFSQNRNFENPEIQIINSIGQEVDVSYKLDSRRINFNLSSLPKGLYIIRVKDGRNILNEKVLIQ